MVLHRYVLALDVAGFIEALAERGGKGRIRRSGIDECDDRHRGLLRARRERPRGCRAAEQCDEVAALIKKTRSHGTIAKRVGLAKRPRSAKGSDQWPVRPSPANHSASCWGSGRISPASITLFAALSWMLTSNLSSSSPVASCSIVQSSDRSCFFTSADRPARITPRIIANGRGFPPVKISEDCIS